MGMMPVTNSNGDVVGGIRARLVADPNVVNACGRNRIRPYMVPTNDPTNTQDVGPADDGFPFIVIYEVGGRSEQESDGMNFESIMIQVSVYGTGFLETRTLARQVNGVLARKKVLNFYGTPVYLLQKSGINPMRDQKLSGDARDVFHVPLRYEVLNTEQTSTLPYP